MNHSTPGLPVHHQLPEFTQTHAHRVSDAIQPSHPLLSPSPPAPNPSQHQGLFQRVNSSHEVAKVLEFQHQSLQWTPRTYIPHNRDLQKGPQGESEAGERQVRGWSPESLLICLAGFCSESHLIGARLSVTPWIIQSMEFSRPEYWSE